MTNMVIIVALTLFGEAAGESVQGKRAVASPLTVSEPVKYKLPACECKRFKTVAKFANGRAVACRARSKQKVTPRGAK